jgi:ABC-type multidrug transport system fused ATPase/permease subunit
VFRPIIFSMQYIVVALIVWYGGGQILRGAITLGLLLAFMRYIDRFFDPINSISEKFNVLQGALAGAERIFDLFDTPTQDYRETQARPDACRGGIECKNVWLSYFDTDDTPCRFVSLLRQTRREDCPGRPQGSGKTSIVSLWDDMYGLSEG